MANILWRSCICTRKGGRVDKIAESSTMEDLRLRAVGRSLTIAAGSLLGLLMIEEKRNFPIFKYIYEPAWRGRPSSGTPPSPQLEDPAFLCRPQIDDDGQSRHWGHHSTVKAALRACSMLRPVVLELNSGSTSPLSTWGLIIFLKKKTSAEWSFPPAQQVGQQNLVLKQLQGWQLEQRRRPWWRRRLRRRRRPTFLWQHHYRLGLVFLASRASVGIFPSWPWMRCARPLLTKVRNRLKFYIWKFWN